MTNLSNKVAVVTGANAGLGFQISLNLARKGYCVVMACRNLDKARKAQTDLQAAVPEANTIIIQLDISEPASVREFVRQFAEQVGQLDLLINNAGIVGIPLARNSAGHELQLATNYLGAFALTGLLLLLFRKDTPARIVNVGSLMNRMSKLDLEDLNWEKTPYHEMHGYGRSKVAMLSFTLELERRLRQSGSNIIALSAHPGFAATEISKNSPALQRKSAIGKWFQKQSERFTPSPAQAALSIVHAACAEDVKGGDYYGPGGFLEIAGKPAKARINPVAQDVAVGKRLWAMTEAMADVRFLSDL